MLSVARTMSGSSCLSGQQASCASISPLQRCDARPARTPLQICIHMVPERVQQEEPVASIVLLAQHLETSRFQDFWVASNSCRDLLAGGALTDGCCPHAAGDKPSVAPANH
jgi:hypothetical protein